MVKGKKNRKNASGKRVEAWKNIEAGERREDVAFLFNVLAKDNELSPMWVVDVAPFVTMHWPSILSITQEATNLLAILVAEPSVCTWQGSCGSA